MKKNPQLAASAGSQRPKRRVFVVEDHPLMRRSLVEAIEREPDLTVCGQVEDAPEVQAVVSLQPDVVLTDLQLKSSSGLDLIKILHAWMPALPIVATTMFDVRRSERLARAAGAVGFVSKQNGPDQLVATIREVLGTGSEHKSGA